MRPRRSNLLSFPAGRTAGLKQGHPANGPNVFSVIKAGSGFFNLARGQAGSGGTYSNVVDGIIGPGGKSSNNTAATTWTGYSTTSLGAYTLAAIFRKDATIVDDTFLSSYFGSPFREKVGLKLGSTQKFQITYDNGNTILTADAFGATVNGNCYFVAISANETSGGADIIVRELNSGKVATNSTSSSLGTGETPSGTVGIFDNGGFQSTALTIAAAMGSFRRLSLADLLFWASDPWTFWYPQQKIIAARTPAPGFISAWARQSNLPVIGGGTF